MSYATRPLRVTQEPALARYWYPVARADAVAEHPVARRLLGTDLVLWRPRPGEVRAAVDRCPHRDARLSDGWLDGCALVCPYHGWEYGEAGRATRIPQLDDGAAIPPRARLDVVASAERFGWVWACLVDDPVLPLPEVPEFDDAAWRVVHEPESEWACPAPLLVENNLDPAHIAFVHRASFGTPAEPKVSPPDVVRTATGLRATSTVPVQNRPGDDAPTVRRTVTEVYGPGFMTIAIRYPDGLGHTMIKACTPVDDGHTRQLQVVLRTDGEDERPAADILAFDAQVWGEDKAVLERAGHDFSLDLTDNVHLRIDRGSIEYRRFLADIVDGRIEPSAHADPLASAPLVGAEP